MYSGRMAASARVSACCDVDDSHINVEVTTGIQSIRYIYKYVYKGYDKIMYELKDGGLAS